MSNVIFLKLFCFKDAVRVKRVDISNDDEFISEIFERNFFAKEASSFCLVQQVSPDDQKKYFIFGIKFDDLYIFDKKGSNVKSIFIYEKTYLIISTDPLCKLFQNICLFILNYKKLNLYQNLEDFNSLLNTEKVMNFYNKNIENKSQCIIEILQFFYSRSFPRKEEYISFHSSITKLSMNNYKHPNKNNERFLAMSYLGETLFKITTPSILYEIIIRVLTEQSIIFITENIQNLTCFILGIYYLIQPFKWPSIIIPNLPLSLLEIIESPVPFLVGILADKKIMDKYVLSFDNINANLLYLDLDSNLSFIEKIPLDFDEPYLNNLKNILKQHLSQAHYYLRKRMVDDYESECELIYKNIYGIFNDNFAKLIENLVKKENFERRSKGIINSEKNIEAEVNCKKMVMDNFVKMQDDNNKQFAKAFAQTQMFAYYVDEIFDIIDKLQKL